MSKILYNGIGYDPIVATDYWSGVQVNRTVWTPCTYKSMGINSIVVSMAAAGQVRLNSSAGDPILGRVYLPSGTTAISSPGGVLYVAPSGITVKATSDCNNACSITIYAYER